MNSNDNIKVSSESNVKKLVKIEEKKESNTSENIILNIISSNEIISSLFNDHEIINN